MHFCVYVVIPRSEKDTDSAVDKVISPFYREKYDWHQIGGRWTGMFGGVPPEKDPRNIERCYLCFGTGTRKDMVVPNGCNGCEGKGESLKWPTEWARNDADRLPLEEALKKFKSPAAVATTDGWFEDNEYDLLKILSDQPNQDKLDLVVVDVHD